MSLTAHHSRPLKTRLTPTQASDQCSASFTPTSWAPCFLSTTKSTNSAASTKPTNTSHSHRGAMVSMSKTFDNRNGVDEQTPSKVLSGRGDGDRPAGCPAAGEDSVLTDTRSARARRCGPGRMDYSP